jgi:uncharacterized SAM-binding protein YcdF (DUF218 family)
LTACKRSTRWPDSKKKNLIVPMHLAAGPGECTRRAEPNGVQMFFYLSKLFWLLAQPLSAAFLLVVIGAGLVAFRKVRWGLGILALSLLVQGAFGFTNLGYILIQPLEDRFPMVTEAPEEVGTIIMLGGATLSRPSTARQIAELNDAGDRLTATLWLAVRYPRARIVISGGSGVMGEAGEAEAETAARFFVDHGVDRERLVLEDQSRNTEENVANTAGLLDGDGLPVVVVTSAFHMPRSMGIFRQAGMDVMAWPTDYRSPGPQRFGIDLANPVQNINVSTVALKEWIGLLVYHWTGRTSELLPSP